MRFPDAAEIRQVQLQSLNELLGQIMPANPFYSRKILEAGLPNHFTSLEEFSNSFPFTTKQEIARDQEEYPPYGQNLTYPLERYSRFHQTSGTSGKPMPWLDTPESWEALVGCWEEVYRAAGVTRRDIGFFAFSFGPFLGFWLAFEAGNRLGMLCIPGGGLSTIARLRAIIDHRASVLCCTPSYAIHLAESAIAERINMKESSVRVIIVAGEPGGSLPATRAHIERLWPGARVFDHHGMTEVGPVTYECPAHPCRLHVVHWGYYGEIVDPISGKAVPAGQKGELILTTLKRTGSPLLRYRTGDLVVAAQNQSSDQPCECGRHDLALEGGILGRSDDMVVVRGVNIYPSAVEQIVRGFSDVAEYQAHITTKGALTEMHLLIEATRTTRDVAALAANLEKALQATLNLRIPVTVSSKPLPRAELKAKRWIRN